VADSTQKSERKFRWFWQAMTRGGLIIFAAWYLAFVVIWAANLNDPDAITVAFSLAVVVYVFAGVFIIPRRYRKPEDQQTLH
jgi:membrane protein YdbS with pleckstrin-like domain